MSRGLLLLGFIFLCFRLFAQSADKELVYHVTKKPDMKLLYGKWWDCVIDGMPKSDSLDRFEWVFTKNGKFSAVVYPKGEKDITVDGVFKLNSDTIYLNISDGIKDTLRVTSLNDKVMKWVGLRREADPDVWVFKRFSFRN